MSNNYVRSLTSVQMSTTRYSLSREEVAASVAELLRPENDTRSITITRPDMSEDSYVFSVTSVYWEPVPPTYSSERQRTSAIPLPGVPSAATS